jgi:hypothetical protein
MNILKKSGANEGYTGGFPFGAFMLLVLILAAITISLLPLSKPQKVEAQFAGQSTFSLPFLVNLPGKTGIQEYVTIPNRGQVAETISYAWSGTCSMVSGTATFQLEGSNDNTNWFALATSQELDTSTGSSAIMYSNGYFTYKRLSFPPCDNISTPPGATFTGVYTGYTSPLPLNFVSPNVKLFGARVFSSLHFPAGFFLISGFQCFNPNGSTAYLFIKTSGYGFAGNPVIAIPQGQLYNYEGPAFIGYGGVTQIGAYTDATHTTAVTNDLACTLELSGGPFYPLSPPIFY